MPATRLILIQHAATGATRRGTFASRADPADPAGLATASALGRALPASTKAFASPATAARETADALGLDAPPHEAFRDLDAGRWAGAGLADLAAEDLAAWRIDPFYAGHGGESVVALLARVAGDLVDRLDIRRTTIAVTHGAVIRAALLATLEAPPSAFWHIDTAPLHALALSSNGRRWALRGFGPLPEAVRASDG